MRLEQELKKELRMTKVRIAILSTIKVAGVITLAAMAPNTLQLLGKHQKKWSTNNLKSTVARLRDKGLLEIRDGNLALTANGLSYLARAELRIERPVRWDKKWRIVIFDITESRKQQRDNLRRTLLEIGFYRLQNSVWVFPYDCEELVTLLKTEYRLGKEVLYMIVDKLENDHSLRQHFDL